MAKKYNKPIIAVQPWGAERTSSIVKMQQMLSLAGMQNLLPMLSVTTPFINHYNYLLHEKALLIGINDYPEGNELTGCIEDINSVKAAIERHGDGSPNFGVKMMPNVQTSGEVMDAIRKLFAGNDDTALFYFSGHGYMNSTGAEIVMPQDIATPGQYYTGIQMSTIMSIVNTSKVRNKIIIWIVVTQAISGNTNFRM